MKGFVVGFAVAAEDVDDWAKVTVIKTEITAMTFITRDIFA